jgi:hypothetical protein
MGHPEMLDEPLTLRPFPCTRRSDEDDPHVVSAGSCRLAGS